MSIDLSENGKEIQNAWKDVVYEEDTNWALFGYEGHSNVLTRIVIGDDIDELRDRYLDDEQVMYAFCKLEDPDTSLSKFVLLNWQGDMVTLARRRNYAKHLQDVARFLAGSDLILSTSDKSDVDIEEILEKVSKKVTKSIKQEVKRLGKLNHTLMMPETPFLLPEYLRDDKSKYKLCSYEWENVEGIPYTHFFIENSNSQHGSWRYEFRPYIPDSDPLMDQGRVMVSLQRPVEKNTKKNQEIDWSSLEENPGSEQEGNFKTNGNKEDDGSSAEEDPESEPDKKSNDNESGKNPIIEIVEEFSLTPDMWSRMNRVNMASNFSFCLRNSEHLMKYIVYGRWISEQMKIGGNLRNHFKEHLDQENVKLIAIMPKELKLDQENSKERKPLFSELKGAITFNKTLDSNEVMAMSEDAYNVIFVGPTGVGKSTLINLLFNEVQLCKTDETSSSVTRDVSVLNGNYTCKDGEDITINVIDTIGFCDTFLEDDEVLRDMLENINIDKSKVVVVCSGIIEDAQEIAMKTLMSTLGYENFKDNFIFIYNKTENLSKPEKNKGLSDMGKKLGVNVNHKIVITVPTGDGALRTSLSFFAGACTGFQPDSFDENCQKTFNLLRDQVLPHSSDVLRDEKRIPA